MAKRDIDEVTIPAMALDAFNDAAQQVSGKASEVSEVKTFTETDIEMVRKQEKDKMYKRLEESDARAKSMEEQVKVLAQDREAALKEATKLAKKEAELLKQREFEELSAKELLLKQEDEFNVKLNTVEAEWRARLDVIDNERQSQAALLEKERRHQELQIYTSRRLSEESEAIAPQLLPLLSGSTEEEIEFSISKMKQASSAIVESVQQASEVSRGRVKGAGVTSPPVGPMETQMEQQTLSADDIRNMSMEQYSKMRDRLLNARSSKGRF